MSWFVVALTREHGVYIGYFSHRNLYLKKNHSKWRFAVWSQRLLTWPSNQSDRKLFFIDLSFISSKNQLHWARAELIVISFVWILFSTVAVVRHRLLVFVLLRTSIEKKRSTLSFLWPFRIECIDKIYTLKQFGWREGPSDLQDKETNSYMHVFWFNCVAI